ncbi:optic atrophy 3 protein-domain-containing protein [Thamnocephalis sphaerospora]|uniref:Optic atrophy 3 protein-domain-containing protein n=1 Tax=Thamnocephalis sphaerospora TaxID=78915 RepID=A0A4P9XV91_9FUNG|nr:optic atrophy 3 protein-domain-containing protein [Thamnocephalis sphaerospora]|eukprot:RKP10183.1 optic atrophy 3 protein-domain-containing protein [Thamnocephalis sphaerospora]
MSSLKLGSLLIRTLAKPISGQLKAYTKKHPRFKQTCISVAQATHRFELNMKMKFLGYKKEAIRPLNDAKAVEAGANFLGETFLFTVAASAIIFETTRQRLSNHAKQQAIDDKLQELRDDIAALKVALDEERERHTLALVEMSGLRQNSDMVQRVLEHLVRAQLTDSVVVHEPAPIAAVHSNDHGHTLLEKLGHAIGLPVQAHAETMEIPIEAISPAVPAAASAPITVTLQARPGLRTTNWPT